MEDRKRRKVSEIKKKGAERERIWKKGKRKEERESKSLRCNKEHKGENKKKEESGKKIEELKYNMEYKKIISKERPKYLQEKMKRRDRTLIARFKCENKIREKEYWKEEEEVLCRVCKKRRVHVTYLKNGGELERRRRWKKY